MKLTDDESLYLLDLLVPRTHFVPPQFRAYPVALPSAEATSIVEKIRKDLTPRAVRVVSYLIRRVTGEA